MTKIGTKFLRLSQVEVDLSIQPRYSDYPDTVARYAEIIREHGRDAMPPPVVFVLDGTYKVADGLHRYKGHVEAAKGADPEVEFEVWEGTEEEAVEYAAGCNAEHGLPRTHDDIRTAILHLLRTEKYKNASATVLKDVVRVSDSMVRRCIRELESAGMIEPRGATKGSDGKVRKKPAPGKPSKVKVNGEEQGEKPDVVRRLEERGRIPDGAVVTIVTDHAEPVSGAGEDEGEPFDPTLTELGQCLTGIPFDRYQIDAATYMHPRIQEIFSILREEKVCEFLNRQFTKARKKSAGQNKRLSPLLARIEWLMKVRHVEDWGFCKECNGVGNTPRDGDCGPCKGEGFRL